MNPTDDLVFSPFVAIEAESSVRGASNAAMSMYNQIRFNVYMKRLLIAGVDQLEHSMRVSKGIAMQARLHRRFKTRKPILSAWAPESKDVHRLKLVVR